jgi:hypothetical protein
MGFPTCPKSRAGFTSASALQARAWAAATSPSATLAGETEVAEQPHNEAISSGPTPRSALRGARLRPKETVALGATEPALTRSPTGRQARLVRRM